MLGKLCILFSMLFILLWREHDSKKTLQRRGIWHKEGSAHGHKGPWARTHLDCCRQCRQKVMLPMVSVHSPEGLSHTP